MPNRSAFAIPECNQYLYMMFQDREDRKDSLRSEIPDEPELDDAHAVRVVLKLPNGTRLERRFMKTDSLKVRIIVLNVLLQSGR